jgi:MinD superfamily P-loop ATPase
MKIAVLSGKGGTGKTMVSVNLAAAARQATYLDCDVEEPNGHLYFKPENPTEVPVSVKIPKVDHAACTGCRTCVDFCKFNALAFINKKVMVFEDVCHSCGGCGIVCPEKAIGEVDKTIGTLMSGTSEGVETHSGFLKPGQASGVPIIKEVLAKAPEDGTLTLIDCPPGSACVVMESIKDADYCVLVAEPTRFGAHNLEMVYELVSLFGKPHGVVLNKCLEGSPNPSEDFCAAHDVPVLGEIPFDLELGAINSSGEILVRSQAHYAALFSELLLKVKEAARRETASDFKR